MTDYNELRRAVELAELDQELARVREAQALLEEVKPLLARSHVLSQRSTRYLKLNRVVLGLMFANMGLTIGSVLLGLGWRGGLVALGLLAPGLIIAGLTGWNQRKWRKVLDETSDRVDRIQLLLPYQSSESEE